MADKTKLPTNWKHVLRESENKTELFGFLADKIVVLSIDNVVIVTKAEQPFLISPISILKAYALATTKKLIQEYLHMLFIKPNKV